MLRWLVEIRPKIFFNKMLAVFVFCLKNQLGKDFQRWNLYLDNADAPCMDCHLVHDMKNGHMNKGKWLGKYSCPMDTSWVMGCRNVDNPIPASLFFPISVRCHSFCQKGKLRKVFYFWKTGGDYGWWLCVARTLVSNQQKVIWWEISKYPIYTISYHKSLLGKRPNIEFLWLVDLTLKIKVADLSPQKTFPETIRHRWIVIFRRI